jgi:hypothetical protein
MKKSLSFALGLLFIAGCSSSNNASEQSQPAQQTINTDAQALLSYQDAITTDYLRAHLTPFAADSMEGRETGTKGQKKAADYLSKQYRSLGLKPVGDNGSYFQHFDLTATRTDSVVFQTYAINKDGGEELVSKSVNSKNSSANFIRQFGSSDTVRAEIVFAGFGLQNQELGIDNFKGIDVKGKWVMVMGGELPQVVAGDTLYTDANQRQFVQGWFRNILQKGVAGIINIQKLDSLEKKFEKDAIGNQQSFGQVSGMQLAYRAQEKGGGSLNLNNISPNHAAKILGLSDLDALNKKKEELTINIKSFNAKETGYGFIQTPYVTDVSLESENVAAFMEGADPQLKDEVVVLSAHYDHLGLSLSSTSDDTVYNGANDDGSGTIGVLSAARAFSKAKANGVKPKRSILFLSVSGEEKGLLGSRYYSDHPIYPIEKTVANINTDMIGRVDPKHQKSGNENYIYIIGGDIISSDMDSLLKAGNARSGQLELDMRYNDLNDPNRFYRRSDHWNFGRFGVPFVFFFNGVHEDYHSTSDEVDKINFELMAKTARSMYATTVMVANADSVPKVDNQEFIEITKGN